ncbi:MAG: hypothetical protein OXH00_21450 [Candidatus Poribacteria bacterium]|nr:hypothetical protein [Candidatus Poribacteria bacterium]
METIRKTQEEIEEAQRTQDQEMLRRHNEIVSELRNSVAAVKELTELTRNIR